LEYLNVLQFGPSAGETEFYYHLEAHASWQSFCLKRRLTNDIPRTVVEADLGRGD